MANVGDAALAGNEYGWVGTYSTAPGGPTNAFEEFWYFGALVFAGLSYILRRLWDRAVLEKSAWAQFQYTTLIVGSILTFTNDLYKLNTEVFQIILPAYIVVWLIESKRRNNNLFGRRATGPPATSLRGCSQGAMRSW